MEKLKLERSHHSDADFLPGVKEVIAKYPYLRIALEELCAHHDYSFEHVRRCGNLAFLLVKRLNFNEEKKDLLIQAALSHDVGKSESSEELLVKKSGFSVEEWEEMKKHPKSNANYIGAYSPIVAKIILRHHLYQENPYPIIPDDDLSQFSDDDKRKIEELSRILAIIDKFETYSGSRNHKKPELLAEFLPKMEKFFDLPEDKKIIGALINVLEEV